MGQNPRRSTTLLWITALSMISLALSCGERRQFPVVGFGGTYQELQDSLIFKPAAKAMRVAIDGISYSGDYGQLAERIRGDKNDWAIVQVESNFLLEGAAQGLLDSIDYQRLPRGADGFVPGATNKYGIAHIGWANVLAWNAARLPTGARPPSAWADLWDTKTYPGRRLLRRIARGNLEVALLADGVSPDSLYPLDVPRALAKLDGIRGSIEWWSSGAESQEKLLNGATMGVLWNGRAWALEREGKPIHHTLNEAIVDYDWWIVPRGQVNIWGNRIWEFLAYASRPDVQAGIARNYGYAPTTIQGVNELTHDEQLDMPTSEQNRVHEIPFDSAWWAQNEARVSAEWNAWLIRK
jgi:putative spermidine/putrescine transport system substrate-binding protein